MAEYHLGLLYDHAPIIFALCIIFQFATSLYLSEEFFPNDENGEDY
jgi:hypothetical protein